MLLITHNIYRDNKDENNEEEKNLTYNIKKHNITYDICNIIYEVY